MYKTRKSSGSASFLNRLQRNARFSSESGVEDEEAGGEAISAEAVLQWLAETKQAAVGALAEHFGATPEVLAEPLGELVRNDCVKVSAAITDPASTVLITPVGIRTAGFAKIARA